MSLRVITDSSQKIGISSQIPLEEVKVTWKKVVVARTNYQMSCRKNMDLQWPVVLKHYKIIIDRK